MAGQILNASKRSASPASGLILTISLLPITLVAGTFPQRISSDIDLNTLSFNSMVALMNNVAHHAHDAFGVGVGWGGIIANIIVVVFRKNVKRYGCFVVYCKQR